MAAKY